MMTEKLLKFKIKCTQQFLFELNQLMERYESDCRDLLRKYNKETVTSDNEYEDFNQCFIDQLNDLEDFINEKREKLNDLNNELNKNKITEKETK